MHDGGQSPRVCLSKGPEVVKKLGHHALAVNMVSVATFSLLKYTSIEIRSNKIEVLNVVYIFGIGKYGVALSCHIP